MNTKELPLFLKSCGIAQKDIDVLLLNKKVKTLNGNMFLVEEQSKFSQGQVTNGDMLWVQLKKHVPTRFLLDWIQQHTDQIVEIHSPKVALRFTYGKPLPEERTSECSEGISLVLHNKQPIGLIEKNKSSITTYMHVGEYLQES